MCGVLGWQLWHVVRMSDSSIRLRRGESNKVKVRDGNE